MTLDFSQNKINIVFEITDDKTVALKEFSLGSDSKEKNLKWCSIADIHLCGENPVF